MNVYNAKLKMRIGTFNVRGSHAEEANYHSYVSTSQDGPRGGRYPGETFYSREELETFIQELRNAAHVAWPECTSIGFLRTREEWNEIYGEGN